MSNGRTYGRVTPKDAKRTREEAIENLAREEAERLVEGFFNSGEGYDFLLANGWIPFDLERAIHKEMAR